MLRKFTFLLILILSLTACDNSDDNNNRNPFLLETNFSITLSTIESLDLDIPSNPIYISEQRAGIRGVFVINTGSGLLAWEASDPNHAPNSCSRMVIDGIEVNCQCEDDHSYNLFTGQAVGEVLQYTMLPYRATRSGNTIRVSN